MLTTDNYVPSIELAALPEACQEALVVGLLPALFNATVPGKPVAPVAERWVVQSLRAEVERLEAEVEGADAAADEARAEARRLTGGDRTRQAGKRAAPPARLTGVAASLRRSALCWRSCSLPAI